MTYLENMVWWKGLTVWFEDTEEGLHIVVKVEGIVKVANAEMPN
jgi:hypothetical protein